MFCTQSIVFQQDLTCSACFVLKVLCFSRTWPVPLVLTSASLDFTALYKLFYLITYLLVFQQDLTCSTRFVLKVLCFSRTWPVPLVLYSKYCVSAGPDLFRMFCSQSVVFQRDLTCSTSFVLIVLFMFQGDLRMFYTSKSNSTYRIQANLKKNIQGKFHYHILFNS